jgi:hypothetical protein
MPYLESIVKAAVDPFLKWGLSLVSKRWQYERNLELLAKHRAAGVDDEWLREETEWLKEELFSPHAQAERHASRMALLQLIGFGVFVSVGQYAWSSGSTWLAAGCFALAVLAVSPIVAGIWGFCRE